MSGNLFINILLIQIGLVLIAIVLELIHYKKIYNKNVSKIHFDIDKECNINFEEKYSELAKKHNRHAKKYIYTWIIVLSMFGIVVGPIITNSLYVCLLFIVIIIVVLLIPQKDRYQVVSDNKKINAEEERYKLKEEYYNLVLNDIILNRFKGEKQKLINDSIEDYDIDNEDTYNLVENEEKENNVFFTKIFKKTNRKSYEAFDVEFCINFKLNNHQIKLYRITNIIREGREHRRLKYIYSFIGYLVEIPNFSNEDKLKNIDKNDYVLDKKTNILYLIISDQIKNSCYGYRKDRFVPKLYLKFEKEKFLEKNYIYFDELYKLICFLINK